MIITLRRLAFFGFLVVFTAAPSCATTSGTGGAGGTNGAGGATPTQVFGTCSTDALKKTGESLIGRITTALATGDYEAEVAKLLTSYTAAEIGCAIDLVASEFTKKAARTNDTETQVVLVHARAWRQAHPAN